MKFMNLVAVVGILAIAGAVVVAADHKDSTTKADALKGKVVKADANSVTVKPFRGDTNVVVAVDANTVVTVDAAKATISDIKADMFVTVTPGTGTATKIEATTKKPEHHSDAKKGD